MDSAAGPASRMSPEWYKRKLAGEQFDIDSATPSAQTDRPTKEGSK